MSNRPAPALLDFGFQCTSKHARVTSPSTEVRNQPEQDPEDHIDTLDPAETAGYVIECG